MNKGSYLFVILLFLASACGQQPSLRISDEYQVPILWADMTLMITKGTPANSPTFASRALGYIGLTMYESVIHSSNAHRSLAGQLNGLGMLPVPAAGQEYNWMLSLNAGQAFILRNIYLQTSDANKMRVDSLEAVIRESIAANVAEEIVDRSVAYGRSVASAIFEWSISDGGHRGYLRNFDSEMNYPAGPGYWKAPFFAQAISRFPLHPHWGDNRTFVPANAGWPMPEFIRHDSSKASRYFREFIEVHQSNESLTQEQKEIALWWNDDPSDTFTPPGHSYNLASIVVRSKKPDLVRAAETYARVGLSVADAFIVCWKMKYHFFSERPSTFISEHIDDEWQPFWPDPPFPAFPSGHATQASAVAATLAGLYGDRMDVVDDTHAGRPMNTVVNVAYRERRFSSFSEIAKETAYSRFLGGIHCAYDNEVGLEQGLVVGNHVNGLRWTKQ